MRSELNYINFTSKMEKNKIKIGRSIDWQTNKAHCEKLIYEAKISPNCLYSPKRRGRKTRSGIIVYSNKI